ncbi:MAG: HFX_2341 family transcriptional regulator domain-containing protein, partial [Candidatus Helarchaeota archaeon]
MQNLDYKKRIHISAVSEEPEFVVYPIIQLKADKVYLISNLNAKDQNLVNNIKEKLDDILQTETNFINYRVRWNDLLENLNQIYKIFITESDNFIYVNCS